MTKQEMKNALERLFGEPICPNCLSTIDPDVCYCGEPINGVHENHSPVPQGCVCGYDNDARRKEAYNNAMNALSDAGEWKD